MRGALLLSPGRHSRVAHVHGHRGRELQDLAGLHDVPVEHLPEHSAQLAEV